MTFKTLCLAAQLVVALVLCAAIITQSQFPALRRGEPPVIWLMKTQGYIALVGFVLMIWGSINMRKRKSNQRYLKFPISPTERGGWLDNR